MKINNNYFASVITGFVTAWSAWCERCEIPFLSQTGTKWMILAGLTVRLTGSVSCIFFYHFPSLPADLGTCVSNLYSHLEHFVSAGAGNCFSMRSEKQGSCIWLYFIQPMDESH